MSTISKEDYGQTDSQWNQILAGFLLVSVLQFLLLVHWTMNVLFEKTCCKFTFRDESNINKVIESTTAGSGASGSPPSPHMSSPHPPPMSDMAMTSLSPYDSNNLNKKIELSTTDSVDVALPQPPSPRLMTKNNNGCCGCLKTLSLPSILNNNNKNNSNNIRKKNGKQEEQEIGKSFRNIDKTLVIIWFSLLFGGLYIWNTAAFSVVFYMDFSMTCKSVTFRHIFIMLQRVLQYYYFIIRLRKVFEGSVYAYSDTLFKILYMVLFFVFWGCTAIYFIVLQGGNCVDPYLVLKGSAPSVVSDIMISIFLLILFVKRMKLVLRNTQQFNMESTLKYEMNIEQRTEENKMRQIIVKLTVLAWVVVSATLICCLLYAFISSLAVMCDLFLNGVCLVLSFTAYHDWYSFCCKPCQSTCEYCVR